MSAEQYRDTHEKENNNEVDKDLLKERDKKLEKQIEDAERNKEKTSDNTLERIRENVERSARSKSEKLTTELDDKQKTRMSTVIDKNAKKAAYKKELTKIRRHLSKPEKQFSKIVHNPTIDKISEFSAKTVARPSGLLGAGFFASLGSLVVYLMSRYYGFEYNFFLFVFFGLAGFFIGILFEMVLYPLLKNNRS